MDRLRLIRWLRIFASAFCLIACGLLIALWSRSYWWADTAFCNELAVVSVRGSAILVREQHIPHSFRNWGMQKEDADNWKKRHGTKHLGRLGFNYASIPRGWLISTPHWLAVLMFATLAALTWTPTRFSLRTMLITTTVVAAVLGLVVWMVR